MLAAAIAIVFGRAVSFPLVSLDDAINLVENPLLNPPTLQSVLAFWRQGYEALFIPFTYTFWALQACVFRAPGTAELPGPLLPQPFHAVNLALHFANAWLVFTLLECFLRHGRPPGPEAHPAPALAGGLLFALHPVQVEPVVWVTGTKDLLCTFLCLLALRLCIAWTDEPTPATSMRRQPRTLRSTRFVLATVAYSLALLSKPSAVAMPAVALVATWALLGRRPRETARLWVGWLALAIPFVLCSRALQLDPVSASATPWPDRPRIAADAIGFYVAKVVAPVSLGVDYGRTPGSVLDSGGWHYPGVAVLFGAFALASCRRVLVGAALLFAGALAPVLGLVPFGFQEYSTVADRYVYLAMLGPALALAWGVNSRPSARVGAAVACVLLAFGVRSSLQVGVWRDSETLYAHSLAVNPASAWLRNSAAHELMQRGREREAIGLLEEALRQRPDYVDAIANLGVALAKLGRLQEAVPRFREAARLQPGRADVHQNLGMALARLGDAEAGKTQLREALRLNPRLAEAHDQLGIALAREGDLQSAARHFAEAVRLQPANRAARQRMERAVREILAHGDVPR